MATNADQQKWRQIRIPAVPRFFKEPPQNSGTVSVPETLYSGTKVGVYILGTQYLNTAPFRARAQALVLGHQVWTWPKSPPPHGRMVRIRTWNSEARVTNLFHVVLLLCLQPLQSFISVGYLHKSMETTRKNDQANKRTSADRSDSKESKEARKPIYCPIATPTRHCLHHKPTTGEDLEND